MSSPAVSAPIRVLHVDDNSSVLDLAETFLEREGENFTIETATSASEGLDHITDAQSGTDPSIDCIVSDYDMPGMNGLEFLEAVREEYPDLPFILFTGKGSEEIASEAISAGVTDYLNKGSGTDQYTVLANRIDNVVSGYRTERELRVANERTRKLYGAVTDAIFVTNAGDEFTYLNDQAEELLDRTEEELLGENILEAFSSAVDTGFQDGYEKAKTQQKPVEFEEFYSPLDVWFEVRVVPLEDGLTAHFRDVSEKKERERTIQRQNERLSTIIENAPVVLFALDEDGLFTLSEGEGLARLGFKSGDLVGESAFDVFADTPITEDIRDAFDGERVNTTVAVEDRVYEAWYQPVENEEVDSRVIGVAVDITERAERKRRFDAVFNNTFQFMGLLQPDGTIVEINDTALEFSDIGRSEIVGRPLWELPPLELSEGTSDRVKEAVYRAASGEFARFEEVLGNGDDVGAIDISITPVIGDHGDVEYLVAEGRDITERKEHERELETTRARFRSLTENTTLGVLTMDDESTIRYANDAVRELFGYAPDELIGESVATIIPDRLEEDHFTAVERYLGEGERTLDWEWSEFPVRHAEGHEITIGVSFGEYVVDGERRFTSVIRDITARKDRETALEERATAMETSMDGMAILDDEGRYTYVNHAHAEIYGYDDPESFAGEHWQMCYDEAELVAFEEEIMPVLEAEGEWRGEATGKRRDGTEFPQELTLTVLDDGGLVCVVRDITERKQREREVERKRDRFATLFENIPDPSVTVDLERGEAITRSVNNEFEDVFGYAPETVVGEPLNDLIVPSDRMDEATAIDRGAVDGEYMEADVCRQTADDELREFLFRSVPIEQGDNREAFGIYTDVTERREHETYRQRLYEITADTELATDETIERVLELGCEYFDMESGFLTNIGNDTQRIVRANSPHEAIQPGSECPLSETYCRKTIEIDEPMTVANAAASGWEGDPAYDRFGLEAYVGAKLTIGDDRYGTVCFADRSPRETDFSELDRSFVDLLVRGVESTLERHKYETDLERQNDQLGEFASVISHDLRNPLTVADGYLELANETGEDEYFMKIGNAHDRMDAIIEDVLTLTRQGERIAETSRMGLAAVAEDAWETVATADAKLVLGEDLGKVDADESRLKQLFENLYRNAVEHAGETTTVRVGRYPAGFYVEDDGPGIPESERERVFDSGYTTGDEGTGMGLSIVDTIAMAHGWGIGVDEEGDGGARFKIQLGMTRGSSDNLLLSD